MKMTLWLYLALPLLAGCGVPAEQPVVAVDAECRLGRPQIDRSWLVFFDRSAGALNERGGRVARELASVFIRNHGSIIVVLGHIDGAEQVSSKHNLGSRRAEAVAAILAEEGVQKGSVFVRDAGFSSPLVPQSLGLSEPQNRYVSLIPYGVDEGFAAFVARCKAVIRKSCFGPVSGEQRKKCDDALELLAPSG
jgi:hypothetical protein